MKLPCALLLSSLLAASAPAATGWTYSFDSLQPGDLIGQDDWQSYKPAPDAAELSPRLVKSGDGARGLLLAQQPFDGKATSRGRKTLPPLHDGRTPLVLEFDARATAPGSIAVFGFGGTDAFPATFGIQFDQFVLREETFGGTTFPAVDASGKRVSPVRGDWYRVRSVWQKDAATGEWSGDLAIRNLSKNETAFTSLYFDRAQKLSSVPLKIDSSRSARQFRLAVVRLGVPGGEIDNLSISPRAP